MKISYHPVSVTEIWDHVENEIHFFAEAFLSKLTIDSIKLPGIPYVSSLCRVVSAKKRPSNIGSFDEYHPSEIILF